MKNFITLALVLIAAFTVNAQQEAMYTQHMFNKLAINPAYAGARNATSITMLYRNQWTGFEGAPKTASISVHSPLRNNKVSLGLLLVNDQLGLIEQTGIYGSYSYRVPVGNGKLSFGMNAGFNRYEYSLVNSVHIDRNDPNLQDDFSRFLPNIGAGAYYQSEKFYAGVSVPHLIENELISSESTTDQADAAHQTRHIMAMGGAVLEVSNNLKFRPSVLVKHAPNAPLQADLNGSFIIKDIVVIGATYRTKASVDAHIEFNVTQQLRIGYAYDYVLNEIGTYTSGSHEILVGFDIDKIGKRIMTPRHVTPRYF